jgi:penicillin-binding protein 2
VTPRPVATDLAALAPGAIVSQPPNVSRLATWVGRVVHPPLREPSTRVDVSSEHLQRVVDGLTRVVEAPRGTGRRARVPGMMVAGKTGTTQVVSLSVVEQFENDEDVPVKWRDHAWFAAFAPADDPEIVVAVLVEHGGGGGSVAAPIAGKVLQAYYDKHFAEPAPELPLEPIEATKPGEPSSATPRLEANAEQDAVRRQRAG